MLYHFSSTGNFFSQFSNHPEKFVLGEGGDNSSLAERANQYIHSGIQVCESIYYAIILSSSLSRGVCQFEFPWESHDLESFANLGDSFLDKVSQRVSEDGSNSFEVKQQLTLSMWV